MNTTYKFLIVLLFASLSGVSQVSFKVKLNDIPEKIERSKTQKIIYALTLTTEVPDSNLFNDYVISIEPDLNKSTLPQTEFEIDFKECTLNKLSKKHDFYLTLFPNANFDVERNIKIDIKISSTKDPKLDNIKNQADEISQTISIKSIESDTTLDQYNYLAYIGTNFDLVDGIKAKNLFFATNIYQLPIISDEGKQTGMGFNFTIYGNRTLTITEEYGPREYKYKYEALPELKGMTRVFTNQGDLSKSFVSDNLGAAFSPMLNINIPKFGWLNLASRSRTLQIVYAPQFEFVWRRFSEATTYSNITAADTTVESLAWNGSGTFILTNDSEVIYDNAYDFNAGIIGVFVSHETKDLSVRFQFNGGISRRFQRDRGSDSVVSYSDFKATGNIFFGARIWITEPTSGITLGAEMSNRIFKNYEPIYNVTLSKALNFKSLGSIFSPISSR